MKLKERVSEELNAKWPWIVISVIVPPIFFFLNRHWFIDADPIGKNLNL
ncbi:hypothetical protein [Listeria cornellensis]|nr:hypothetical protein [Listeria cornellensis]